MRTLTQIVVRSLRVNIFGHSRLCQRNRVIVVVIVIVIVILIVVAVVVVIAISFVAIVVFVG